MFKLKLINKQKMMKLKCNFTFPNVVLANLQEKETTPTKEKQQIIADQQYDGLSKVVVNAIPDEYIIPNGDINIIENGTYDVTNKINAIVNIPEKKLGSKMITKNGTYKAVDDNLNGYSEVKVETSGVDIYDYFLRTAEQYGGISYLLKKIPSIDMLNRTSLNSYFTGRNIEEIGDLLNTDKVTNVTSMFSGAKKLKNPPFFNTENVTLMTQMFYSCSGLLTIPQYNTVNVVNMENMFYDNSKLISVPKLLANKVVNVGNMFSGCISLTDFGGLENLGQAYSTTHTANYSNYTLTLSSCTKLTHDSLMNVINNLYDIKTAGVQTQKLVLGSTNKSKLTAEEIAIATNKGWTVS